MEQQKLRIAFFGTPLIAYTVLDELKDAGIIPSLIVTNPDAQVGRKHIETPPPAKVWAQENSVTVFQPESLKDKSNLDEITSKSWDLFIVVAYGKMMPSWLIDLPKYKTLNAHPSLLPKLRGASPIRSALLSDLNAVGVTIMLLDEKMDHGPILDQLPTTLTHPIPGTELDLNLAHQCGLMLAHVIPKWIAGEITPIQQDHENATFCGKITKEMGKIEIDPYNLPEGEVAEKIVRKACAFDGWPGLFFFYNEKRIKIQYARFVGVRDNKLYITHVIPEGKNETEFTTFFRK